MVSGLTLELVRPCCYNRFGNFSYTIFGCSLQQNVYTKVRDKRPRGSEV